MKNTNYKLSILSAILGSLLLIVASPLFVRGDKTSASEFLVSGPAAKLGISSRASIRHFDLAISELDESFGINAPQNDYLSMFVAPSISSISPSSPQTSVTDQNVIVNGSGFVSGLTITVTFPSGGTTILSGSQIVNVSSSSLTMKITMTATGTWKIRINNPNGEVSNTFSFNVSAAQTPHINSISPSSPTIGNSDQSVSVSGTNFQSGMTVAVFIPGGGTATLSGSQLTNVTQTSFTMIVTLNVVGQYGIRVNNPSNLQSNTFNFNTQAASPTITSVSPSSPCVNGNNQNVTVSGSNFVSGLTVTVFLPGGGTATLSGSQIQNVTSTSFTMVVTLNIQGTYGIRVNNPSGVQSNTFNFATQFCVSINSITPSTPTVSNSDQSVTVNGSSFQSGLTVTVIIPGGGTATLSGSQIQNVTSSSFTMVVTLNIVGTYGIRVNNPNGNQSNVFNFNTQNAGPVITSVNPSNPCVNGNNQNLTVGGSNFVSGLTVTVFFPGGGSTVLSGSQIQNVTSTSFTLVATLNILGSYSLRVTNPSGVSSNSFGVTTQLCVTVTSISPAGPAVSNSDQNIAVSGSGFQAGLTVTVLIPGGGTATLSGSQIQNVTSSSFTMVITLNIVGTYGIRVNNPNGNQSNVFNFATVAAAAPAVSSISPESPVARNDDQNVVVSGTNFVQGLTVTLSFPGGGTGTLSGTQIQNVTSTSFTMRVTLGVAGAWTMRVNNPNGTQSGPFNFTVLSGVQAPVIYSINPASPIARSGDQDVIVTGSNFQQGLQVPITFPAGGGTTLSGAQIQNVTPTSFIMRATLNAAGGWTIRVNNPDGGSSAVFSFTVGNGTNPVVNTINPATPLTNGADQDVIVNGANFQTGLSVNVTFPGGGIGSLQGTGQIQNVTASSFKMRITLNAAGSWTMRVLNPDNSQSQQFQFNVNPSGPAPTGLPTSVLSPVIGPLRVTATGMGINDGKWEFNQHGTGAHTATGGISLSDDTKAWDANLYTSTNGNADVGKAVFATAPGQVVTYVGTQPGAGPGAILIAHPNASAPIWFSGYLHMNNIQVALNQFVDSNTVLGDVGRIGANNDHLHFVVYSGQNTRGNLSSFNPTITERLSNNSTVPVITSIVPDHVTQSVEGQVITVNGTDFQPNSILEVQDPHQHSFTITPSQISVVSTARILKTTSSTITAQVPFAFDGTYTVNVINRSTNLERHSESSSSFATSAYGSVISSPSSINDTPVVLIPGVMGSRLGKKTTGDSYTEIFPSLPFSYDKYVNLKNSIGFGNPIEDRPIIATDILKEYLGGHGGNFYGTLIDSFTGSYTGYTLYNVNSPVQRTLRGCDDNQRNANFFIFPYDWRSSNEQSARDLKELIDCVKHLHDPNNSNPNFKVNIIAHSQGGLVARRYILEGLYGTSQNYDPKVKTLVTLGTPWLGAPKFMNVLITGEHESLNILMNRAFVRDIARYMPGPQELIPSTAYADELRDVNPGDYPFGEEYDYDGRNGVERRYSFNSIMLLMNLYNPPNTNILPGTNTRNFHDRLYGGRRLQDNWANDQTGVTYYNFVGRCLTNQGANNTVGSIIASTEWYQDWLGIWRQKFVLRPAMSRGDCTVPEISGMRQSNVNTAFLGPAIPKVFENVSHGGFPNSLRVIDCLRRLFVGGSLNSCSNASQDFVESNTRVQDEPAYNLNILGSTMVSIIDSFGNTTSPLSTSGDEGVPTISTNVTGDDFLNAVIPSDQRYKINLRTSASPLVITITKNVGQVTTLAVRYLDLSIPPNVDAQFEITPDGVEVLKYDSDGDGTFDTAVTATITATGPLAQDTEPPQVVINETVQNGGSTINLQAIDRGSGVRGIMYSTDGSTFQPYSTPITLNAALTPTVYAFADDNVFNRSGTVSLNLTASIQGFGIVGPGSAPVGGTALANWTAPTGRPVNDWVGLFKIGALNSDFISKQYTDGAPSGNLLFTMPAQIGTYEFRYLVNDVYSSVATSAPIKVGTNRRIAFDYDGDGKSDVSVFRPSTGAWYLNQSTAGVYGLTWGFSTDVITPADYDGDHKTDVAIFRPSEGRWYIFNSATSTVTISLWGAATDIPAPADYDGDGRADISIFRPSDGNWWLNRSTLGTTTIPYGQNGDVPAAGDYDGDGKADVAVFRPSNGVWSIHKSSGGDLGYAFGFGTDKIVPADYDGDLKTDIAVFRPSTGTWYIANSATPTFVATAFGAPTDIPAPGDYDGDGKADIAIFRPSDGNWWLNRSTAGLIVTQFGQNGDRPTQNAYGN